MFFLEYSQSANPWIYVTNGTNGRGCLNEGAMNQPIETPGIIRNLQKQNVIRELF